MSRIKKILKAIIGPIYRILLKQLAGSLSPFWQEDIYRLSSANFGFLYDVMCLTRVFNVGGDYLEFGVFKGETLVKAFHAAQAENLKSMKFYAFDSFKGLPEIEGVDADGFCYFSKGDYACSIDEFKKYILKQGVDLDKIEIIPGWYNEILNEETKKKLPIRKASLVWIDCDLYESAVFVLDFITDYVCDGTILYFDDWFSFRGDPNRGEERAFREWLKKNPSIKAREFGRVTLWGMAFIINRD